MSPVPDTCVQRTPVNRSNSHRRLFPLINGLWPQRSLSWSHGLLIVCHVILCLRPVTPKVSVSLTSGPLRTLLPSGTPIPAFPQPTPLGLSSDGPSSGKPSLTPRAGFGDPSKFPHPGPAYSGLSLFGNTSVSPTGPSAQRGQARGRLGHCAVPTSGRAQKKHLVRARQPGTGAYTWWSSKVGL